MTYYIIEIFDQSSSIVVSEKNMSAENRFDYPDTKIDHKDGRQSLRELYNNYFFKLLKDGWKIEQVYNQQFELDKNLIDLPIFAFISPNAIKPTPMTLWDLNGIHGEEPAPVQAQADKIEVIRSLPDLGIPVVAIFTANPKGYVLDWRYPNLKRYRPIFHNFPPNRGKSVGDFDHLLPKQKISFFPRRLKPTSRYAEQFTRWILNRSMFNIPALVVNHHEDELINNGLIRDSEFFYAYAYGNIEILNIVCPIVTKILEKSGYKMQQKGETRFGEEIQSGWVINALDGSTDEFLSSRYILQRYVKREKDGAVVALVPETIIHHNNPQSIPERALIHGEIIDNYVILWENSVG